MNEPIITRRAPFRATTWDPETRTFEAIVATAAPVARWDIQGEYDEELASEGMRAGPTVPFLDDHARGLDADCGHADNLRAVGGDVRGRVTLSRHSPKALRIAAELSDGRTFGISIGYTVAKWRERKDAKTGRRIKTAVDWQLLEVSRVTIPADPNTGIRTMPNTEPANTPTPAAPPPPAAAEPAPESAVAARAAINVEIRSIARIAGLGATFADSQIDAGATVEQARAAAFDAMRTRSAPAGQVRTQASVGTDHGDPAAIRSAMADALAHRLAPGVVKLEGRAAEYRGMSALDMVGALAVAGGARINLRDRDVLLQRAVGAHSTSDFPLLLADAANKALLAQYQVAAPTYRKWAARKPFTDFKEHSFLRAGDFPAFKEIAENGELQYGSISESAEKVRAKEYGAGLAIGRRALINDDLSALADFSATTALRAGADENRLAYGVLAANAALSDGKALFHADHGNLAAAGSTLAAGVAAAVAALRGQKSLDGLPLNLQPAFLVVGPAQEVAARQLLANVVAAKAADVNVWAGFAELIVDAEITDNRWHLFAAPAAAPVVVFGYVGGAEGPQVRTERDFDTQAIKIAAGLDFAVGAIDFRGVYKNAGA